MNTSNNNNKNKIISCPLKNVITNLFGISGVIWIGSSLGAPLWTSLYVRELGLKKKLLCNNEDGKIYNLETNQNIEIKSSFEKNIAESINFSWYSMLGPISIPISAIYAISSTYNFMVYKRP